MCQILGMNCATPTDFTFSLKGFCRRGGETDVHSHGFGLCSFEGRGIRSFHDTLPACKSPIAELVQNYPLRTHNMMAHIRYATQGQVSLENVHPFHRVWKGVPICFCHNGECPKFSNLITEENVPLLGRTRRCDRIYHPVGDTDSEAVFCALLNALQAEFPGNELPTLPVLHHFLASTCNEIITGHSEETIFNFLLCCGQYTLFAYSWPGRRPNSNVWNGLHYIIRQPPFTTAKLRDDDYIIDFATITTPDDRVAVITTVPLTEEPGWTEFQRGELLMFNHGNVYKTPKCCEVVEQQGRGLFSKWFSPKCRANMMTTPNTITTCITSSLSSSSLMIEPSCPSIANMGLNSSSRSSSCASASSIMSPVPTTTSSSSSSSPYTTMSRNVVLVKPPCISFHQSLGQIEGRDNYDTGSHNNGSCNSMNGDDGDNGGNQQREKIHQ